jgi:hypothetical protein
MSHVPAPRTPADQLADTAAAARLVHRRVLSELERAVLRVRLSGGSWAMVGAAAGVSRAAAHKRWRHLDDWGDHGIDVVLVDGGVVFVSTALAEPIEPGWGSQIQAAGQLRAIAAGQR